MKRRFQIGQSLRVWLVVSAGMSALACVVEDRNFDKEFAKRFQSDDSDDSAPNDKDDGGQVNPGAGNSALCTKYCTEIEAVCTGDNAMYPSEESCLANCAQLEEAPPKGESATGTNTVLCRYEELQEAKEEARFHCPRAGLASQACGTPCQTYCRIHAEVCDLPTELQLEQLECERRCAGIPSTQTFSLTANYDDDSIQCRLIHLATAATGLAEVHCPHARIASPLVCGDSKPVSCKNYCTTLSVACTGEFTQYTSQKTCERTCMALPQGEMLDRDTDSVGCRHYHAYASLGSPEFHCSHAGPTTDGHCGEPETSNCENYCVLANAACEDEFSAAYKNTAGCMSACMPLPGSAPDSEYPPSSSDAGEIQVVQRLILAATKVLGEEKGASCDDVFLP